MTVSVPIPLKISAKEFACRLINAHKIPCYLEEGGSRDELIKEENIFFFSIGHHAVFLGIL